MAKTRGRCFNRAVFNAGTAAWNKNMPAFPLPPLSTQRIRANLEGMRGMASCGLQQAGWPSSVTAHSRRVMSLAHFVLQSFGVCALRPCFGVKWSWAAIVQHGLL